MIRKNQPIRNIPYIALRTKKPLEPGMLLVFMDAW